MPQASSSSFSLKISLCSTPFEVSNFANHAIATVSLPIGKPEMKEVNFPSSLF